MLLCIRKNFRIFVRQKVKPASQRLVRVNTWEHIIKFSKNGISLIKDYVAKIICGKYTYFYL